MELLLDSEVRARLARLLGLTVEVPQGGSIYDAMERREWGETEAFVDQVYGPVLEGHDPPAHLLDADGAFRLALSEEEVRLVAGLLRDLSVSYSTARPWSGLTPEEEPIVARLRAALAS